METQEAWQMAEGVLNGAVAPDALHKLAAYVHAQRWPHGKPVTAVDDNGTARCSECGNDEFGYLEGCEDYRTPDGQRDRTVRVYWSSDGTADSGDGNPGLFCDNYQANGCGRPIDLPEGWDIDFT